jgi:hypothetical protein
MANAREGSWENRDATGVVDQQPVPAGSPDPAALAEVGGRCTSARRVPPMPRPLSGRHTVPGGWKIACIGCSMSASATTSAGCAKGPSTTDPVGPAPVRHVPAAPRQAVPKRSLRSRQPVANEPTVDCCGRRQNSQKSPATVFACYISTVSATSTNSAILSKFM